MPPKAVLVAWVLVVVITTLGLLGIQSDTSIAKSSKQLIEWYREIIT